MQQLDKFKNKRLVNFSNKFDKFIKNIGYENLENFYISITSNINSNFILKKDITSSEFTFKENEVFSFQNVSNLKKSLIIDQANYLSTIYFTKVIAQWQIHLKLGVL